MFGAKIPHQTASLKTLPAMLKSETAKNNDTVCHIATLTLL